MDYIQKIDYMITYLLKFITLVLLFVSTISVIAQIFFRYVIQFPALWTEALARYSMIVLTFFGSALAIKTNSHIRLTIFINNIKNKMLKNWLIIFLKLIEFSYLILLLVSLNQVNQMTGRFKASSLSIPMSVIYISIIIGVILMLYEIVVVINNSFKKTINETRKYT